MAAAIIVAWIHYVSIMLMMATAIYAPHPARNACTRK